MTNPEMNAGLSFTGQEMRAGGLHASLEELNGRAPLSEHEEISIEYDQEEDVFRMYLTAVTADSGLRTWARSVAFPAKLLLELAERRCLNAEERAFYAREAADAAEDDVEEEDIYAAEEPMTDATRRWHLLRLHTLLGDARKQLVEVGMEAAALGLTDELVSFNP
ncbi:hypothetical protein [Kaistia terrae]|uniref:Uncharacterized protein n=1 Tax=Kaistia terrae TaxID=537017 RepID=A0ABW0PYW5_9HYPH|nr:hypothetical protein [Kaistia terrae]MCX5580785.1 hypothetical protein [Kaistia terrae]